MVRWYGVVSQNHPLQLLLQ